MSKQKQKHITESQLKRTLFRISSKDGWIGVGPNNNSTKLCHIVLFFFIDERMEFRFRPGAVKA